MEVIVEKKPTPNPTTLNNFHYLVPIRIAEIRCLLAGSLNTVREETLKEWCVVGDVCFTVRDEQNYSVRLFLCRHGKLAPAYFHHYLLFVEADDVKRIVLAKPEN